MRIVLFVLITALRNIVAGESRVRIGEEGGGGRMMFAEYVYVCCVFC